MASQEPSRAFPHFEAQVFAPPCLSLGAGLASDDGLRSPLLEGSDGQLRSREPIRGLRQGDAGRRPRGRRARTRETSVCRSAPRSRGSKSQARAKAKIRESGKRLRLLEPQSSCEAGLVPRLQPLHPRTLPQQPKHKQPNTSKQPNNQNTTSKPTNQPTKLNQPKPNQPTPNQPKGWAHSCEIDGRGARHHAVWGACGACAGAVLVRWCRRRGRCW